MLGTAPASYYTIHRTAFVRAVLLIFNSFQLVEQSVRGLGAGMAYGLGLLGLGLQSCIVVFPHSASA